MPPADGRTLFTSDPHYFHTNILRHANRPFRDLDHMHRELVARWNDVVSPLDTVWLLGDLALGRTQDALDLIAGLPGRKKLVGGNHDRFSPLGRETAAARDRWRAVYEAAGLEIQPDQTEIDLIDEQTGQPVRFAVCHLPYAGDSREGERYTDARPVDRGLPLLHGHTHGKWDTRRNPAPPHSPMVDVGVDSPGTGFAPVDGQVLVDLVFGRRTGLAA